MASSNHPTPTIRHRLTPTPAQTLLSAQPTLDPSNIPGDARICPICQEPFSSGSISSERAVKLPCHHIMGADCLATWLKEHNTCPMCRTTLFEKPGITIPVPGPHVLAAVGAFHELLRRVQLASVLAGEDEGEGLGGDGVFPGTGSLERAVEANADDSATPRINSSQQVTGYEAQALELAQVPQLENRACLSRLRELESEAVAEENAVEISRMRDRMMGIERRLMGLRERFGRRGLGERFDI